MLSGITIVFFFFKHHSVKLRDFLTLRKSRFASYLYEEVQIELFLGSMLFYLIITTLCEACNIPTADLI